MAGPTIDVEYRANTKPLEQGLKSAESTSKSTTKSIGTIAAGVFGGAVMAKAASAAKNYFSGAISMAMDAEQANARFATSLKNIVGASDSQIAGAQSFIASMSKTAAVSKGELRPAFETLLRGTHDITKAQGGLKTALDISAGTGKPLSQVSQAITKGYLGNVGALGRLGIATKDASGKTLTMDQVMKNAASTFGGQAAKQADTAAGRMKNFQLQMKGLQTTVGQDLMPVITNLTDLFSKTLLPALQFVADLFKKYPGIMQGVAAAILVAIVALKLWNLYQNENVIVTGLVTAAQWLWNAAMAANPMVLLVILIVALVAIIVALLVKFGILQTAAAWVWNALQTAFHAIVAAGQWLWNWFKSNWPTLLAILAGPIGIAIMLIMRNWDTLKGAASAVWNFVKGAFQKLVDFFRGIPGAIAGFFSRIGEILKTPIAAAQALWDGVRNAINKVVDFITGLPGRIGGALSSLGNALKAPINAFIRGWNAIELTVPGVKLPFGKSIGGFTIGLPDIPLLAKGGLVRTAGLAYLHPAEVVSPAPANGNGRGPAVMIQEAHFSDQVDIDLFMRRVAWAVRTGVT